ncbi:MAG: hypothetical protein QOD70_889 [Frankiales bacterium]|nr:hypothetical protein [Frankiales bacterium]
MACSRPGTSVRDMDEILASVVVDACRKDPSLPADAAQSLAATALQTPADADAPEIARTLLATDTALDVSWVNAVATTVAEVRSA